MTTGVLYSGNFFALTGGLGAGNATLLAALAAAAYACPAEAGRGVIQDRVTIGGMADALAVKQFACPAVARIRRARSLRPLAGARRRGRAPASITSCSYRYRFLA